MIIDYDHSIRRQQQQQKHGIYLHLLSNDYYRLINYVPVIKFDSFVFIRNNISLAISLMF